jgi:hypothetical protein
MDIELKARSVAEFGGGGDLFEIVPFEEEP